MKASAGSPGSVAGSIASAVVKEESRLRRLFHNLPIAAAADAGRVAFVEVEVAFQKMSGTDSAHHVLKHESAITADLQRDYLPVVDLVTSSIFGVEMYVPLRDDEPSGLCDGTGRADDLERKRTVQVARFSDRAFRRAKPEHITCQDLALCLGTGRAEDAHAVQSALGSDDSHRSRGRELPGCTSSLVLVRL